MFYTVCCAQQFHYVFVNFEKKCRQTLSLTPLVSNVTRQASASLYTRKTLKLLVRMAKIWFEWSRCTWRHASNTFNPTIIYASPSWPGFLEADEIVEAIQSVPNKAIRYDLFTFVLPHSW